MVSAPKYLYWDSCVFIAYIVKESHRLSIVESLLEEVGNSNGKTKIITSALAQVEVSFVEAERQSKQLNPNAEKNT